VGVGGVGQHDTVAHADPRMADGGMFLELVEEGVFGGADLSVGIGNLVGISSPVHADPSSRHVIPSDATALHFQQQRAFVMVSDDEINFPVTGRSGRRPRQPGDAVEHGVLWSEPIFERLVDSALRSAERVHSDRHRKRAREHRCHGSWTITQSGTLARS
jgi:hypothetical protein